jgi:hypothetical protein
VCDGVLSEMASVIKVAAVSGCDRQGFTSRIFSWFGFLLRLSFPSINELNKKKEKNIISKRDARVMLCEGSRGRVFVLDTCFKRVITTRGTIDANIAV